MRILAVLFFLGLSAGALARSVAENVQKIPFSLEEILYSKLKGFNARWISEKEFEFKDPTTGHIMVHNMKEERILVESSVLKKYNCTSYEFSSDNSYVLLRYDDKENYRHSVISRYVVYSLKDKVYSDVAKKDYLQHAEWIPGRNAVVFIKDNNIYTADLKKLTDTYQITKTGIPGQIYNGVCDWIYEEEILGKGDSFSFSPNGEQMIYLTIDNTKVKEARFMSYGEPGSMKDQYAKEVAIRYPKPGTVLPEYEVWHYNSTDRSTSRIAKYQPGREMVYGWKWVTDTSFAIVYANRVQNVTETDLCRLEKHSCKKVFEDRNPKGWANFDVPTFSKTGDWFLARVRQKFDNDEYYHIQLFSTDGSKRTVLTNGNFMVRQILSWDEAGRIVYYKASAVGQPSSDHVYALPENAGGDSYCITCQMKSPEQTPCKAGSVDFSKNYLYFLGKCRGPTPSFVSLYAWSRPNKVELLGKVDVNAAMRKLMNERLQPQQMDLTVKVTKTIAADVRLLLPPDIDTSGKKKYPMIIYVYGGPDNPQVTDNFRFDWSLYLTTNRSIIYGIIDGRGTGRKGTEMMYALYRALGTVEIQDQIAVTENITNSLNFIDKDRVGIWGWSYGGYATAKVLEEDVKGIFKCGVSVAPVSDWIYYNTIYTERYMGLPSGNPEGYRKASTLYNVENMRKKRYLLMHGTGDDNVHYQHAMHLAKALQRKNIIFEQEAYPDEAHGISHLKPHVYFTMDEFWKQCFT